MNFLSRVSLRSAIVLLAILVAAVVLCSITYTLVVIRKSSDKDALDKKATRIDSILKSLINDNVRKISASSDDLRETMGLPYPPIPEFEIENKYHPIILKAFIPATRYNEAASRDNTTLAYITITTKMEDVVHVAFYDAGQIPLRFSVDGVRYTRSGPRKPFHIDKRDEYYADEGAMLYNIIREISKEQTTNKKSEELTQLVDKLEKTIGEERKRGQREFEK